MRSLVGWGVKTNHDKRYGRKRKESLSLFPSTEGRARGDDRLISESSKKVLLFGGGRLTTTWVRLTTLVRLTTRRFEPVVKHSNLAGKWSAVFVDHFRWSSSFGFGDPVFFHPGSPVRVVLRPCSSCVPRPGALRDKSYEVRLSASGQRKQLSILVCRFGVQFLKGPVPVSLVVRCSRFPAARCWIGSQLASWRVISCT